MAESPLPPGTTLAGRYQVIQYPLVQDLQPEEPPTPLETVPSLAKPYLALSRFSVAIPRPFTQVLHPDQGTPLLLLEEIPLQSATEATSPPSLLPALPEVWEGAPALHQLTWLWRLSKLWQPCLDNQVAHGLLDWQNLRIDGEDIRLLRLDSRDEPLTLVHLGQQWQSLVATAAPPIRDYLSHLTQLLTADKGTPESVIYSLIQAIEALSPQHSVTAQVATYSDQGPTRSRNEDACYPESGFVGQATVTVATADKTPAPLVVVCDGVGGHQGGDVASNTAIAEVTHHLSQLAATANVSHRQMVDALKQAILTANQSISDRNDADQREDRNRMGTTIVIALVYGPRLYIAHLGDSRAYRVRSHNCRQITLDDDVAAREMRLGLELYQDALQHPGSGALVQALGMAHSNHLRPTVKLYPIATDSLFVLCSDGLSDNELLERFWQAELKPVLTGDRDVATAGQRLIELANTHNGHDNVTVGLLRLLPERADYRTPIPTSLADLVLTAPPTPSLIEPTIAVTAPPRPAPNSTRSAKQATGRRLSTIATIGLMVALLGGLGGLGWLWFIREPAFSPSIESSDSGETLSPSAVPPNAPQRGTPAALTVGDQLQIQPLSDPSAAVTLLDVATPPVPEPPGAVGLPERLLPVGSIVQVVSRQKTPNDEIWVRLEVCSVTTPPAEGVSTAIPPSNEVNEAVEDVSDRPFPLAQPGDQGWLLETELQVLSEPLIDTSSQQGRCMDE
jgi:serine/threonine protein phosphatase PrpC